MSEFKHDLGGTFKGSRNEGLDGIRGLAALSVALGHCYLVAFGLDIWRATVRDLFTLLPEDIGYRLLSLAFPADPAVMVFFVLSGNVLWQSFVRKRLNRGSFLDYVLSRLWRLMPPIAAATVLMDYFTQVSGTELVANTLLLHTNVLGVTWSLQVEMVGSLAIFAMWLWGRDSLPKMMAAVAVAIASVLFLRGTVLVYLPAFALGGLISSIPASVWRSRALFWCGLALLLTANLFFSHSGITRCFEIAGATAVVGCMGTRPLRMLQSPLVQLLGTISYPLYLCHPIAVAAIGGVVETLTGSHRLTAFALISFASLVLAVPLAWLLHVGIEVPAMRGRQKLPALKWQKRQTSLLSQPESEPASNGGGVIKV